MRVLISTLMLICGMAAAGPALAQATAVGQHNNWGVYSYTADNGKKVCYAMSVPSEKKPSSLNHGEIFFFVSQKDGQKIASEPQFIAGYNFQSNSKVNVTIGNKTFTMFTKGSSAWLQDSAEEPQMIAAMKAGATMQVSATSGRGNNTSYVFSLSGVTAAINATGDCK
ncbi:invasion associated locus B family protein [Nitratireductor sp. GISD-1A_MAKvit]|uniref:invasion associated locus B family protein n=1 Tax=Nitratireductor sp. GISD-1A_MAKvit TaxID=3234198 RepID=UPI003465F9BD